MAGIPSNIFHYTNLNSLKLILESNELWFTDVRFMNDSSELVFAHRLFVKMLEGAFKKVHSEGVLLEDFIGKLTNQFQSEYYSFSLSVNCDSLSLWRGYASPPSGVCVHFDRRKLIEYLISKFDSSIPDQRIFNTLWTEIKYVDSGADALEVLQSDHQLSGIVNRLCQFYLEYLAQDAGRRDDFFGRNVNERTEIRKDLIMFSMLRSGYKHNAFREEGEVRFVVQPPMEGYLSAELVYKVDRSKYIPCYPIQIPDLRSYVTGLTIGPTIDPDLALKSMNFFFAFKRLKCRAIKVRNSLSTVVV